MFIEKQNLFDKSILFPDWRPSSFNRIPYIIFFQKSNFQQFPRRRKRLNETLMTFQFRFSLWKLIKTRQIYYSWSWQTILLDYSAQVSVCTWLRQASCRPNPEALKYLRKTRAIYTIRIMPSNSNWHKSKLKASFITSTEV